MLVARGHTRLGGAWLWSGLVLGTRGGLVVIDRENLVFDARFVPGSAGMTRRHVLLYLLLRGSFEIVGGKPIEGPAAFVLTEEQFEGAEGARPFVYRTTGSSFRAIEVHVALDDLSTSCLEPGMPPPTFALDAPAWAACGELFAQGDYGDDEMIARSASLVGHLARLGIVDDAVTDSFRGSPGNASRLWRALRPVVERHASLSTLKEVAGDLSLRQIARDVETFSAAYKLFVRAGWRETTARFRLKLAVVFSSAEGAAVADIAKTVGYGSSDAMSRAFRDAGLPPPREVQRALRRAIDANAD